MLKRRFNYLNISSNIPIYSNCTPLPILCLNIAFFRSPKGGCCSISDDLSCSFKWIKDVIWRYLQWVSESKPRNKKFFFITFSDIIMSVAKGMQCTYAVMRDGMLWNRRWRSNITDKAYRYVLNKVNLKQNTNTHKRIPEYKTFRWKYRK